MRVAATGHRPDKIGGYDWYAPQRLWIRDQIKHALVDLKATHGISGMALGVDQDFAYACIELSIPFTAAVPFVGQESSWPKHSQDWFDWLLERADEVIIVSSGGYDAYKMQVRNEWMVDHCDVLLAVWDGTKGGTFNCLSYAKHPNVNRTIRPIDPRDFHGRQTNPQ